MRLPDDRSKYSHKWSWVELGLYLPDKDRVIRISKEILPRTNPKTWVPITVDISEVEAFADKNNRTGIYTSVFNYDNSDWNEASRLGSIYFDLDNDDIEIARIDAIKLVEYFSDMLTPEQMRIYFTGKKGYHIECEALAVGITPTYDLAAIYRLLANDVKDILGLESIDFAVYDVRRMWRLPNTKHQSTGLYKVPIAYEDLLAGTSHIMDKAVAPIFEEVPEQQFSYKANKWYKEYVYKYEQSLVEQHSVEDIITWFHKRGTSGIKKDTSEKIFNPINLFDNCPTILRLWSKAEETGHLEHEERLFLCSILSYTEEAVEYLHMIFSSCYDYNFEKSQSHIDDWLARRRMGIGGRPYSCRRANEAGVGCGSCDLEPKKKWIRIGDTFVESEEFSEPSPIRFAYASVTINK